MRAVSAFFLLNILYLVTSIILGVPSNKSNVVDISCEARSHIQEISVLIGPKLFLENSKNLISPKDFLLTFC